MQYRPLGKTGWQVSVIGFGAWGIGGQWGQVTEGDAVASLHAAREAGMNFFDTADAYGEPPGLSETLVGRAFPGSGPGAGSGPGSDGLFIASKVGNWARRLGKAIAYTDPLHVELCCDASLYRLRRDCIDLYQCHLGTPTPVETEVFLAAFDQLIKKGKIRAFGISTHSVAAAETFHRTGKLAAVQLEYNLLNRTAEADLLPWCLKNQVGTIIRGPLAKGLVTGKFTPQTRFDDSVRTGWNQGAPREEMLRSLATMEKLRFMEQPGRSLAQASLQFVLSHPAVTCAIPGVKNVTQARMNAAAGNDTLDATTLAKVQTVLSA